MGNVLKWYVLFGFPVLAEAPLYLLPEVISEGIYKTCGKRNYEEFSQGSLFTANKELQAEKAR
jgi:hypothetical protein